MVISTSTIRLREIAQWPPSSVNPRPITQQAIEVPLSVCSSRHRLYDSELKKKDASVPYTLIFILKENIPTCYIKQICNKYYVDNPSFWLIRS